MALRFVGGRRAGGEWHECQSGHGVGVEDGETFERLEEDFRGVASGGVVRPVRAGEELRFRPGGHVRLEESIGIVEVGNNHGEAGEVLAPFLGEGATAREEARERTRLDGAHGVGESPGDGELGDVRVAEDFEVRLRELPPECRQHRQREDEVADGTAADDEDFIVRRDFQWQEFAEGQAQSSKLKAQEKLQRPGSKGRIVSSWWK